MNGFTYRQQREKQRRHGYNDLEKIVKSVSIVSEFIEKIPKVIPILEKAEQELRGLSKKPWPKLFK